MNRNGNRFQRQGFIVLMVCSAIMLGIGIIMILNNIDSTGILTDKSETSAGRPISWQTPIFAATISLFLGFKIKPDDPPVPKMDVQEKRTFIFSKIAALFKENDFKKQGNNFFKSNGSIGYCANIQNGKWNSAERVKFTINLGIYTDRFWLEHYDFKNSGVTPSFPKEVECAVRERIGILLTQNEDRWYCITPDTDVMKLWAEIKHGITNYAMPFFAQYNTESDIVQESIYLSKRR